MTETALNPKQYIAASCPAVEVAGGGQAGGGKSWLAVHVNRLRAKHAPGTAHIFFRRITNDLRPSVREAKKSIPIKGRSAKYEAVYSQPESTHLFTFTNGSELVMQHMQLEEHKENHASAEYQTITFEEAGSFLPSQLAFLATRLRASTPELDSIGGLKMFLTFNKRGPGASYLRTEYAEPHPEMVEEVLYYWPIEETAPIWHDILARYGTFKTDKQRESAKREWIAEIQARGLGWRAYDDETRRTKKDIAPYDVWRPRKDIVDPDLVAEYGDDPMPTRCFIPAELSDNPHLGREYAMQIIRSGERTARNLLKGEWLDSEGAFFAEFKENYFHEDGRAVQWHVIDPIAPGPFDAVYGGMDWGYSNRSMCVIGFYFYSTDRRQWVRFNEVAVNELTDSQIYQEYLAKKGPYRIVSVYGDPSMWKKADDQEGETRGERFQRYGMPLTQALNQRQDGWAALREMLSPNPETGLPHLAITRNCAYAIKTLPQLMYDPHKAEELDQGGHPQDHAADEMRYVAVALQALERGDRPSSEPVGVGSYQPGIILPESDAPWMSWDEYEALLKG